MNRLVLNLVVAATVLLQLDTSASARGRRGCCQPCYQMCYFPSCPLPERTDPNSGLAYPDESPIPGKGFFYSWGKSKAPETSGGVTYKYQVMKARLVTSPSETDPATVEPVVVGFSSPPITDPTYPGEWSFKHRVDTGISSTTQFYLRIYYKKYVEGGSSTDYYDRYGPFTRTQPSRVTQTDESANP